MLKLRIKNSYSRNYFLTVVVALRGGGDGGRSAGRLYF